MKGKAVPPNSIRRGHNIYIFEKRNKKDQIYWVDHYASYTSGFNNDDLMMGELLVSFDRYRIFNLWCDYPWKFTPEQKALFDKENPYWANFFKRRNGTEPPQLATKAPQYILKTRQPINWQLTLLGCRKHMWYTK